MIEFATFYGIEPVELVVRNTGKFQRVLEEAAGRGEGDVRDYLGGVWGEGMFAFPFFPSCSFLSILFAFGFVFKRSADWVIFWV